MVKFDFGKIPQSGWKVLPPSHFQNIPVEEITYTGKIPPYGVKNSHFETHHMEKIFRIIWQNFLTKRTKKSLNVCAICQ